MNAHWKLHLLPLLALSCAAGRPRAQPDIPIEPPPSLASGVVDPLTMRLVSRGGDAGGAADARAAAAEAGSDGGDDAEPTFSERGAIEALDRVSSVFSIQHDAGRKRIVLPSDDLFEPGRETMTNAATLRLVDLATALRAQGPHTIRVIGFTDSLGDAKENVAVSERRADVVRSYFVAHGVNPDRIVAEGRGAAQPVASNANAEGRAANRRIEVIIE